MALVIQKYGGTSVGTPERIQHVAKRIAATVGGGDQVVVVVSAMGGATDELMALARSISEEPNRREMDMLLSAGERVSMALLSMALHARDVPAISFTGSQSGIITDTAHTRARIQDVRPIRIGPELDRGRVVIVAGFQGVSPEKEVTTLGRGGSDTTAVALASALKASRCEIYTDVPGVMTGDPRIVPEAALVGEVSWSLMTELASRGAGVMHHRAAGLARELQIPYTVLSAMDNRSGTSVGDFADGDSRFVTGLPSIISAGAACDDGTYSALAQALEPYDASCFGAQQAERGFIICADDVEALDTLKQTPAAEITLRNGFAAVSLVGNVPPEAADRAPSLLRENGVPVHQQESARGCLTLLVAEEGYAEAIRLLHRTFAV